MGKTALVTGCSSGIGLATTERLLSDGWHVIGLSRRTSDIDHPGFSHRCMDLSQLCAEEQTLKEIGAIDALVHAAGVMRVGNHTEATLSDAELMWHTHVESAFLLLKHLTPSMPNGARIVLIGSRAAQGAANKSLYAASKAAYTGLARSVAIELMDRAITANVISPAATDTPMLKDPSRAGTPPVVPPFGRLIQPQEIAGTVAFLLSDAAASITGQNISVCAGATL